MLIEQIIEFELKVPRHLGPDRTCIPKTGYFHDKTKISKAKSSIEVLFNAKHIAKGNVPCFP